MLKQIVSEGRGLTENKKLGEENEVLKSDLSCLGVQIRLGVDRKHRHTGKLRSTAAHVGDCGVGSRIRPYDWKLPEILNLLVESQESPLNGAPHRWNAASNPCNSRKRKDTFWRMFV